LMVANSLNAFNDNLARIAGPAMGGLVSPSAGSLLSVWSEWLQGIRLVAGELHVAVLFVILGAAMLADSILSALIAPFVGGVLGAPASLFGLLLMLRGVGGPIGGVFLGSVATRVRQENVLVISLIAVGVVTLVFVTVPFVLVSMACAVALGVPAVGWIASQQTLLQESVTNEFLGRIFVAAKAKTTFMIFAGSLAAGALGDVAEIVPLFIFSAVIYCAAALLALVLLGLPQKGRREHRA